jgi:hypothetical protein
MAPIRKQIRIANALVPTILAKENVIPADAGTQWRACGVTKEHEAKTRHRSAQVKSFFPPSVANSILVRLQSESNFKNE